MFPQTLIKLYTGPPKYAGPGPGQNAPDIHYYSLKVKGEVTCLLCDTIVKFIAASLLDNQTEVSLSEHKLLLPLTTAVVTTYSCHNFIIIIADVSCC